MTTTDDFAPIAEQGELAPPQGFFAVARRRLELPSVAAGFELVLIGGDGRPLVDPDGRPLRAGHGAVATDSRLSSGEIRNGRARSWVKVDMREHVIEHRASFQEPSGSAGFVATIVVACAVSDAAAVAARGIEGVRGAIGGVLNNATAGVAANLELLGEGDQRRALSAARLAAERALQGKLPSSVNGVHADWLSVRVESVALAFDEVTQHLHAELVERSHKGLVYTEDTKQDKREADHQMEMRARRREALSPYLTAPGTRAIEHVLDDPSAENIANVVDHLNAIEAKQQEQAYEVLKELIKEKYVHEPSEVPKVMKAILKNVNWGLPALGGGERPNEITDGKSRAGGGRSGRSKASAGGRGSGEREGAQEHAETVDAESVDVASVDADSEAADA
jgi:hypothetical protein